MKTDALFATGIDKVELIDVNVPEPGTGEVLIETIYSSISPGTELRCLTGKPPASGFPFVPGYSLVGRVVARGAEVALGEGTLVFCRGTQKCDRPILWGAHTRHALCRASEVFPVPANVDPLDAVFAKLAAIAYRGVRLAATQPHHQVAVIGLGPIGQFAARLHALTGARTVAADVDPFRVSVAQKAGVEAITAGKSLIETFRTMQPEGADIVVDATGASSVLQQAMLLAKSKPWDNTLTEPTKLVVQGSYPGDITFDYRETFRRELIILFPRDQQSHDIETTLRLIAARKLQARDLASRIVCPTDAQSIYSALRASMAGLLTAVFQWKK